MSKSTLQPSYFVREDGVFNRIDIDELIYMETARNYLHLCSSNEKVTIRMKIDDALAALPKDQFVKVHRFFAVRVDYIDVVAKDHLVLRSLTNMAIPIGKAFYPELLKRITVLG